MTNTKSSWKELPVKEKIQYFLAVLFGLASVAIGFVAFIILLNIPSSVIGISGMWASVSLGCIGIGMFFHNKMVEFETKVDERLSRLKYDAEIKKE
jgi:hypothetical protein